MRSTHAALRPEDQPEDRAARRSPVPAGRGCRRSPGRSCAIRATTCSIPSAAPSSASTASLAPRAARIGGRLRQGFVQAFSVSPVAGRRAARRWSPASRLGLAAGFERLVPQVRRERRAGARPDGQPRRRRRRRPAGERALLRRRRHDRARLRARPRHLSLGCDPRRHAERSGVSDRRQRPGGVEPRAADAVLEGSGRASGFVDAGNVFRRVSQI